MLPSFRDDSLQGKRIAVVGLGKSGTAIAKYCVKHGASVLGLDEKPKSLLSTAALLDELNVPVQEISLAPLLSSHLIVLSPGVPPKLPSLLAAKEAGIPMVGELEFAAKRIRAQIIGITGTNGKSTVTSLCGAIANVTGRPSFCGGNLGTPLIEAVGTEAAQATGIVVCEMSSFQLENTSSLHCRAAAILNVTPDHLDRYDSFQAYADAKTRIAQHQTSSDILVLNADDGEVLASIERNYGKRPALYFSTEPSSKMEPALLHGLIQKDQLVLQGLPSLERQEFYPISELNLIGRHNLANVLAALLLMRGSGLATYDQARKAVAAFLPLPHRMEKVTTFNGITYYDDSKGTNVDAVAKSLDGFPTPFALIAGGKDKGGSYAPLAEVLTKNQVRGVVLIGEAAPLIEKALLPSILPLFAASMEEAVSLATRLCQTGDAVILSPACSSFDMFQNYEHRAEVFRNAVAMLKKKEERVS